jgi:hypothetical protein
MFQPPWLTRRTRWAVPAGAVAAVALVAAGTAITSAASTTPSLPHRTAAQLIADVAATKTWPQALSGTIATSAALGLPSLPSAGGPERSSPLSPSWLLTGSHTYQVWFGGEGYLRIAAAVQLGETDLRVSPTSAWLWDSQANTATRYIPSTAGAAPAAPPGHSKTSVAYSSSLSVAWDPASDPAGPPPTPQQIAQQFLAAVGPATTVSVAGSITVAGRAAYQLVLAPKSSQSLIGRLAIAVDAATHLPLQVQVFARGAASPAFSVGFTALSFARPDPSNFTFTPPPGAKVRTVRLSAPHGPFPGPPQMAGPGQAGPPHERLRLGGRPSGLRCGKLSPRVHIGTRRCVILFPHGPHMTNPVSPEQFAVLTRGGRGTPAFGLAVPCKPEGPQIHLEPKGCLPQKELARLKGLQGCQSGWSAYSPATGLTDPGPCARRTFGSSWTTVVAFPAGSGNQAAGPLGLLLRAARPVHGSWGSGRLLTTSLLSVLVTSDGRVLAGAVTPATLYADAAQLKAP